MCSHVEQSSKKKEGFWMSLTSLFMEGHGASSTNALAMKGLNQSFEPETLLNGNLSNSASKCVALHQVQIISKK